MVIGKKDKQRIKALEEQVKALEARLVSKDVDIQQLQKSLDEQHEKFTSVRTMFSLMQDKYNKIHTELTRLVEV